MRVPIRRAEKNKRQSIDYCVTQAKFDELRRQLEKLKKAQPAAISEVERLAQMGDFSENAAYQIAKGRLRGLNQRILELSEFLARAQIIKRNEKTDFVQVGHLITIKNNASEKTYRILGASETNPGAGVISRHSPLGSALLNKKVGDKVTIKMANKETVWEIVEIK